MFHIRIIPATISVALLLLCVRVVDLTHSAEALAQASSATTSKDAAATAPATTPATPTPNKPAEASGSKEGDKKPNPNVTETAGDIVDHRFTPVELDLLQNLVRRREELDRWEKNIEIKEAALDATEKRVDDKIVQIEGMKKEVAALLAQYNEKEDVKIHSLVKIYESMKPKDAARIFDEVDMPILLLVIDKMPEKKTAPILALMDPKKAKQITVQLAEQKRLGSNKITDLPTIPPSK